MSWIDDLAGDDKSNDKDKDKRPNQLEELKRDYETGNYIGPGDPGYKPYITPRW